MVQKMEPSSVYVGVFKKKVRRNNEFKFKLMRPLLQVALFRELCGKPADAVHTHMDAQGIKKLFSHGIRRFLARTSSRDAQPYFVVSFYVLLCFSPNSLLLGFYLRKKRAGHTHWPRP